MKSLPEILRERMHQSGQTVSAIARGSGIAIPVLHRFIHGQRDLTLRTATKLADYFGLSMLPISPKVDDAIDEALAALHVMEFDARQAGHELYAARIRRLFKVYPRLALRRKQLVKRAKAGDATVQSLFDDACQRLNVAKEGD